MSQSFVNVVVLDMMSHFSWSVRVFLVVIYSEGWGVDSVSKKEEDEE